jgi:hypothetical protein
MGTQGLNAGRRHVPHDVKKKKEVAVLLLAVFIHFRRK